MTSTGPGTPPARTGRPTMLDVAEAAGVSRALVSIVFRGAPGASEQSRAHVMEVADRLGFSPNRSASLLKLRRNRHLGVAMDVRSTFHAELVEGIQAAADSAGYEVVLSAVTSGRPEERAVSTLLDFRCEALLLLGTGLDDDALTELARRVPLVLVGGARARGALDVVRSSDERGSGLVVDHLATLGHQRLVHVDGGPTWTSTERRRGFRRALDRHGLREVTVLSGGNDEAAGARAAERLLDAEELPTAVCAYNDRVAIGVLERLGRAGVTVPDDVSVTGYDDTAFAGLLAIDLTSVNQEAQLQARGAVEAAVERLDGGRSEVAERVFEPRLVVRGSTAPPRG
ncbi:transcriptional regulator, LacI family [Microlunatus sagamiharensis]|uniref:Transcriptional regulator, LacI family n=1 Tax=Microlunatus sagamiharensis TaxID=546874 RepID=A0A1H2LLT2_9ACTN|nr:LacI family DNA-binding transcriptional regulator [Microlunatus sagamiharensis]SDU81715.1 transcriptional regulator, LacI family [Microlunatus sagamiharensis]